MLCMIATGMRASCHSASAAVAEWPATLVGSQWLGMAFGQGAWCRNSNSVPLPLSHPLPGGCVRCGRCMRCLKHSSRWRCVVGLPCCCDALRISDCDTSFVSQMMTAL